jgi:hypothetical protein
MEIPTIAPADIVHFHALYSEFKSLQDQASAAIEAAKSNKDAEITIAREGQPVVLTEGDLWTEVWHLGADSEAGKILSEKYPGPFRLSKESEEKKAEMTAFALGKWKIDPLAMTLSDIMRIAEAVVDYKLAQKV